MYIGWYFRHVSPSLLELQQFKLANGCVRNYRLIIKHGFRIIIAYELISAFFFTLYSRKIYLQKRLQYGGVVLARFNNVLQFRNSAIDLKKTPSIKPNYDQNCKGAHCPSTSPPYHFLSSNCYLFLPTLSYFLPVFPFSFPSHNVIPTQFSFHLQKLRSIAFTSATSTLPFSSLLPPSRYFPPYHPLFSVSVFTSICPSFLPW